MHTLASALECVCFHAYLQPHPLGSHCVGLVGLWELHFGQAMILTLCQSGKSLLAPHGGHTPGLWGASLAGWAGHTTVGSDQEATLPVPPTFTSIFAQQSHILLPLILHSSRFICFLSFLHK